MAVVQYAYDSQIRRFVLQFIRMLSNFQVEFGQDANGNRTLQTVPVYYGDVSRQAAMILKNNSENTLNAVPAMAAYISGLTYDRDRVLNPSFEGSMRVREQIYNEESQSYTGMQDGLYTVERMMPAPYKLQMKLDIWTSNTEQKHQLWEQIAPLFNPALEIQNSDNYVDWGSLSAVFLTDTQYSNRSIPMGADGDTIDIATFSFEMPIWLNLPAKVKKMGVITNIISSIYDAQGDLSADAITSLSGLMSQTKTTPMNYSVVYMGNALTLYQAGAHEVVNENGDIVYGSPVKWAGLINLYGRLINGVSQIRLQFRHPTGTHEIVGQVAYDPIDEHNLLFTPISSTLPANTMNPVTAIIDPTNVKVDSNILNPAVGTRYLILAPIGDANSPSAIAWAGAAGTNLLANANDIIEWNGTFWHVSFDSRQEPNIQYVTNLNTTVQYCWTGSTWVKSYEGIYPSGEWSLVL
jgi:hypothetical protein